MAYQIKYDSNGFTDVYGQLYKWKDISYIGIRACQNGNTEIFLYDSDHKKLNKTRAAANVKDEFIQGLLRNARYYGIKIENVEGFDTQWKVTFAIKIIVIVAAVIFGISACHSLIADSDPVVDEHGNMYYDRGKAEEGGHSSREATPYDKERVWNETLGK